MARTDKEEPKLVTMLDGRVVGDDSGVKWIADTFGVSQSRARNAFALLKPLSWEEDDDEEKEKPPPE